MGYFKINKGLDLPIGSPVGSDTVSGTRKVSRVALLGTDYPGIKPRLLVKIGDSVKIGQALFTDKRLESVFFPSPACGRISAVNRGARRTLASLVIDVSGEQETHGDVVFPKDWQALSGPEIKNVLLKSGLWTAIRSRPFEKIADPGAFPTSLFVTAMDTRPLAPPVSALIRGNEKAFETGLLLLQKMTGATVHVCCKANERVPVAASEKICVHVFDGPHPAGNPGTHIHFVDPVWRGKQVWHLGLQDTIAIGRFFIEKRLSFERIVALAGPGVKNPRLVKTIIGASLIELTDGELLPGLFRVISGSVLNGHHAAGDIAFLGRYHQQVSVLREGGERRLLGWLAPGKKSFSFFRTVLSGFMPNRSYDFSTDMNGSVRPVIPLGAMEKVMPLDILPTILVKSLLAGDVEEAENLGVLELAEEDLALCSLVCPSKIDYGAELRKILNLIEKEG